MKPTITIIFGASLLAGASVLSASLVISGVNMRATLNVNELIGRAVTLLDESTQAGSRDESTQAGSRAPDMADLAAYR